MAKCCIWFDSIRRLELNRGGTSPLPRPHSFHQLHQLHQSFASPQRHFLFDFHTSSNNNYCLIIQLSVWTCFFGLLDSTSQRVEKRKRTRLTISMSTTSQSGVKKLPMYAKLPAQYHAGAQFAFGRSSTSQEQHRTVYIC
jgi:hypothetical protein